MKVPQPESAESQAELGARAPTNASSDPATLGEHLERFRSPLVALIASWGAPWSEAIELAQDSFSEAYLRRANCRGDWRSPDFFGRWLRGVARNRYRHWARRRRRDRDRRDLTTDSLNTTETPATESDVSTAIEDEERNERLRSAIRDLPESLRSVILMRYFEDTSLAEIARLLGTSVRAVEGRLYQARKKLHARLSNEDSTTLRGALLCL